MDDDWASDTITILDEVVGVIPRRPILSSLPRVGAGLTWGKSALSNTWNTVVGVGAQLANSVPMNSSTVIGHAVGNLDDNVVTPVALNCRTWDGGRASVVGDGKALAAGAVKVAGGIGDGQAVLAGFASIGPRCGVVTVDIEATAPRLPVACAVAG